jgi:hypothetical protein
MRQSVLLDHGAYGEREDHGDKKDDFLAGEFHCKPGSSVT